jgi:hypothetical protein
MATTRGLTQAVRRERFVEYIFRKYTKGAKLIECHGGLSRQVSPRYAQVPEDTVIIFLSNFGQCMSIEHGRHLSNEYFTSRKRLLRFFRGEAGYARVHHGEIASRTFLPNEEYPNAWLQFYDATIPDFGHVWKLPLRYKRAEESNELRTRTRTVTGENVYTNIPRAQNSNMTLQDVINKLGPGVYIVNACLVPVNQGRLPVGRLPFNLPLGDPNRRVGIARTRNARAYAKTIYGPSPRPPRPRTPARTLSVLKSLSARRAKVPHVSVAEMLTRLGRSGANINLNNWFPRMRANVNRDRLRAVQRILQNPKPMTNKLKENELRQWRSLTWNQKGPFVSSWLNRAGWIFQAKYNNKEFWFNANTGRQISQPSQNTLNGVNWSNQVQNAFSNLRVAPNVPINRSRDNIMWTAWRRK